MRGYWIDPIDERFSFRYEVTNGNFSTKTYSLEAALRICKELNRDVTAPPMDVLREAGELK